MEPNRSQKSQRGRCRSKAAGLEVAALGFGSGFLVPVAAQSGEARGGFGAWRLGYAVVALGRVSGKGWTCLNPEEETHNLDKLDGKTLGKKKNFLN